MTWAKYLFYLSLFFLFIHKANENLLDISGILFIISFFLAALSLWIPVLIKIVRILLHWLSLFFFNQKKFEALLEDFIYEQWDISSTEEILEKGTEILKQINKIQRWRMKFSWNTNMDIDYYNYAITYCHNILIDMKLDLSKNIETNQGKLRKIQSELSQHSHTDHGKKITALQSARLDRQIEQFEELQKVLIKI